MRVSAYTCSSRNLPHFTARGGPLNSDPRSEGMLMGWHITDDSGHTVGVARDSEFVNLAVNATRLGELLLEADALYQLGERRDQGYMDDMSREDWEELKGLLARLTKLGMKP